MSQSYFRSDTVAALSSAVGGAIAIVRISGPGAFQALQQLSQSAKNEKREPAKLVRTQLYQRNGKALDDAMSVSFYAPNSFTGEDLVELHIHGGAFIAQRVLEDLGTFGVRQALPGEFSFRAVRNGKMSLFQAQAISDLIQAKNDPALGIAVEKLLGNHSEFLNTLALDLRQLASLGELGIDFSDQDIEEVSIPALRLRASKIQTLLQKLEDSFERGTKIQEGFKAVFVGLPNAGKSTLFNAFLGEDRSIVSEVAGTTRDVVREHLTLRGKKTSITLRLEDTAGLRQTHDKIEKFGIDRTIQAAGQADLVFFLVDPASEPEAAFHQWDDLVKNTRPDLAKNTLGIITKADLCSEEEIRAFIDQSRAFGIQQWLVTSAKSGDGVSEAVEFIVSFCESRTPHTPGEILLTRLDHLAAVRKAKSEISQALVETETELFASDIRQALHSLSPLIGETSTDDLLEKIFSDFCIGK
ncbi:MAG: tRNA uridine-5-carboxymethylaminomethyl(34) synthesis GTPase MnmE [Bdellovibrio sp.]|nr:tRNA uridine-5-carboxymethylaminomethyl(34) synthesis GTPase MnmE [Bdellovibrio sp.]